MLFILPVAFLAGILTILAPCTLPVVPLVVGATSSGGGRRVAGVLIGFGGTFVALTVVLAAALAAAGVTTSALRLIAAALLAIAGAAIAAPRLGDVLETGLARAGAIRSGRARALGPGIDGPASGGRRTGSPLGGLGSGLVLGAAIGLLWAPCVGPIMAGVIAIATTAGPSPGAVAVAVSYVAGVALPLLAVAHWGRAMSASIRGLRGRRFRRLGGLLMTVTAVAVIAGWDVSLTAAVGQALPAGWGTALLAPEQQTQVLEGIDSMRSAFVGTAGGDAAAPTSSATAGGASLPPPVAEQLPVSVALENLGPAPEVRGITAWINSAPLTLASLRGKVVLVHFWTFDCINCQNVQPYVKAWYSRYESNGFVVLGIHTPELSFERDIANVRAAVADKGVTFPVAFDPDYATWNAYRNSYWPAFYFIDKAGQIRHVHFGEGDYAGSEQVIRELLAEPG